MQILVENSGYHLQNMGDVAMLQVAARRFAELWPGVELHIVTDAPDRLARYCPGAIPVSPKLRRDYLDVRLVPARVRLLSGAIYSRMISAEAAARQRGSRIWFSLLRLKGLLRRSETSAAIEFGRLLKSSDCVVATGGGYLTDTFPYMAHGVLSTLAAAQEMNRPVALFGQGIGPLEDSAIVEKARSVFPRVRMLGLRESVKGNLIARSLGAKSDRICVTGDDAIELAYNVRPKDLSHGVGVNLRMASYANVESSDLVVVGQVVREFAASQGVPLIPVPISFYDDQEDSRAIRDILSPESAASSVSDMVEDDPEAIARAAGRCRIVVTGSYHAAVFGLSQGVSVIALLRSRYYADKFAGLADAFGTGCRVVTLDGDNLRGRLSTAITESWSRATLVRAELLAAAADQVMKSRAAYRRLRDELIGRVEHRGRLAKVN